MPIISCPHCGAQRNTPNEKLPTKAVNARCPACQQAFRFDPRTLNPPKTAEEPELCCPHCGLPRAIPQHRRASQRATVTCRRCQHSFQLNQAAGRAAPNHRQAEKLHGIGQLLTDSWELFCQRGWGLLVIYLLASLLIFAPLLLAASFLLTLSKQNPALLWGSLLGSGAFGLLGGAWMIASLFSHISNRQIGVFAAINQGRKQLWQFAGLLLLLGLIVSGGSLLLILPGIIFAIWFFFCHYVLAEEGLTGLQALERSRQLVRGHWWAVFGRFMLLLLVALAISTLTTRLPIIGAPLNFIFSLLLTPFFLLYSYLLYQDLKRCQHPAPDPTASFGIPLITALLGWMLIPGGLFVINSWQKLPATNITVEGSAIVSQLFNHDQALLLEQAEQPPAVPLPPTPKALSRADYEQLLAKQQLTTPQNGINLGPTTLSAAHFWSDEQEPHLWLKLQVTDFPNLALSHSRSTRIRIDKVLDTSARDRYDREHSFEHDSFHWIDILAGTSADEGYSGIRNVYLKQGTRPEQIRSIIGQLELNLPLGVESLQFDRNDIGRTVQVAGKALTLEKLNKDGVTLRYQGKRSELLSIRAVNQQSEPLREAGNTWQKVGKVFSLRQMFNGNVDSVTVLIASDSVTRSYPFEITR